MLAAAGCVGAGVAGCHTQCSAGNSVRFSMCQINVTEDKKENIATARKAVAEAAAQGGQLVVLPEIWNGPYAASSFPKYAEPIPATAAELSAEANPSTFMLAQVAKQHKVWLIGGSISERSPDGKIYNTCLVFNSEGEIVAKHRKVHLFDINIPGRITFKESETLSPGDNCTTFDSPWGKVGVGICYDMRFAELALLMRRQGCKLLVYPGAFNMTTGPAHWELLHRARAVDNQVYVAGVCAARNPATAYQAWGHSTVVSPWADVVATTDHAPAIITTTLDMDKVEEIRGQVPISFQRREDIYTLSSPKL